MIITTSFQKKFQKRLEENKLKYPVCLNLDVDFNSLENPVRYLNNLIEATKDLVCAYKLNFAFYLAHGSQKMLPIALKCVPENIPTIFDAKFGDIDNTNEKYAQYAFEELKVDAVTTTLLMGKRSLTPFLKYHDKFTFIVCSPTSRTKLDGSTQSELDRTVEDLIINHYFRKTLDILNRHSNVGMVISPSDYQSIEVGLGARIQLLCPGIGKQGFEAKKTMSIWEEQEEKGTPPLFCIGRSVLEDIDETNFDAKKIGEKLNEFFG